MVHPKGALVVDCNNIDNPDELYKVTTFSVDETRKQRKIDAASKWAIWTRNRHCPKMPSLT